MMTIFTNLFKRICLINENYEKYIKDVNKSDLPNKNNIIEAINKHRILRNLNRLKQEDKDISKILSKKNYQNILNVISKYNENDFLTKDSLRKNIIYSNEYYNVYKINNYYECIKISSGTKWCISQSPNRIVNGEKAFKKYIKEPNNQLYIVRSKFKITSLPSDFFAFIYLPSENKWVIFNGSNMQINTKGSVDYLLKKDVPVYDIVKIHPGSKIRKDPYIIDLRN